jgi:hypothetical protein
MKKRILNAKIIWFPKKLTQITFDKISNIISWDEKHLNDVRQYIKEDGLLFPGVIKNEEIHCGHYRFKVAKEMGYEGMDVYQVETFKEVLELTKFSELCYKHYKEYKKLGFLNDI